MTDSMAKRRRAEIPALTARELFAFFSKVSQVDETLRSCWEWTGAKDQHGYGRFGIRRKNRRAHVVAWVIENGPISEGLELDHLCRNRSCVRPDHMELVSHRENLIRGDISRPRGTNGKWRAAS
jgi:hypothetical protein